MVDDVVFVLTLIAVLGCGLIAGVFYAFSTFVMKALAKLPAPQGIAAMQSINIVVINPWFLGVFLGSAVVCAVLTVAAVVRWSGLESALVVVASALYVSGCVGVTMRCNVPRNNALEKLSPGGAESEAKWREYVAEWTWWNHVRTVASLGAAGVFGVVLGW